MSSTYESEAHSESTSGNITGFNLTGGIERSFGAIGVELFGKYIMGSIELQMQVDPGKSLATEEISLNGFKAGITLKYLF